jgi:hypothetical protein
MSALLTLNRGLGFQPALRSRFTQFPFLLILTVNASFYTATHFHYGSDHVGVVAGGIYAG